MKTSGSVQDVVEDTDITLDQIEQSFGLEVTRLVEGYTKFSKIKIRSNTQGLPTMAQDLSVIIMKLSDRLLWMKTLQYLPEDKRRAIAKETREIYAPLANRLGLWHFKWELEDLAFKYLEPDAFRQIRALVAEKRTAREERLANVAVMLRVRLLEAGIRVFDISGRPKHLYSIYQKMQRQQKEFHEIYDLAGLRIIVMDNEECYSANSVVHDVFNPIPGRFKDYIAVPKPNRYQSLHTGVVAPWGRPLEVQTRTLKMHHVAEYGIAAHWWYKKTGTSSNSQLTAMDEKLTWLRLQLQWHNDIQDLQEYMDANCDRPALISPLVKGGVSLSSK